MYYDAESKKGEYIDGKKLNRGRLIRKYIGEGLREEGFSYAGYKGDVWEFQRIYKENIIQSIYIYVYRFDPWQITFHLGTNLPGKGIIVKKTRGGL